MAALIFVSLFVALGLGVLLLAMSSGGRKRTGRPSDTRARRVQRLATFGFVVALIALGVGVPAAVIGSVESRDSIPEHNVAKLTASEKRGREVFGEHCRNCHTLAASNAVAQVGPNLDQLRPPASLVRDAVDKGRARGNGQMAADLVEGQEAKDVAAYVAKAVGQTGQAGAK
jgi:mono/diheme cytochrome c family protein